MKKIKTIALDYINKIKGWFVRNKLTFYVIIFFILVILGLWIYFKIKEKQRLNEFDKAINQKEQEFKEVLNKKTNEISYQQKVIEYERSISKIVEKELLQQLKTDLRVETKNIKDLIAAKYSTSNSGTTSNVKTEIDTPNQSGNTPNNGGEVIYPKYTFNWTDSFLTATVSASKNEGRIEYTYTDSIRVAGFVKKKGFLGLGGSDYMVDIKFQNPKTKVQSMRSIKFDKDPKPKFSIGVGVGYYYFPAQNKLAPGIGITLQRNLFSF